ncbi:MAG: ribonuclease III [Thermotogae bacterium]|uniref:ribonuclease III n=1 Tax=Kosmotoga sp. TaxID=1955248 RepID=UPI000F1239FC|nr:ribonuclease III [Kosmotoga sp.]MBO8166838.1 ribonuclease III [Kosmotoga sp.]RKX51216.1 MAG: ribonuclease III [Thermotogota bacterium]
MEEALKRAKKFIGTLGVEGVDTELMLRALCHSSFANENTALNLESNERLEFLGDAILDFVLAEILYTEYSLNEGEMSKIRSTVASEIILSVVAREIKLGDFLLLGKGEENSGGRTKDSLLADAFEAVLAAIYLSKGLEEARNFAEKVLKKYINQALSGELVMDYKTRLQEYTQKNFGVRPEYRLKGKQENETFFVEVYLDGKLLGYGEGKTKKRAEQQAAKSAYEKFLKGENLNA